MIRAKLQLKRLGHTEAKLKDRFIFESTEDCREFWSPLKIDFCKLPHKVKKLACTDLLKYLDLGTGQDLCSWQSQTTPARLNLCLCAASQSLPTAAMYNLFE